MTRATFFQHFDLLADPPDAVAKVGELLRLYDKLATHLTQSGTHGEQLLAATLRQLLAA